MVCYEKGDPMPSRIDQSQRPPPLLDSLVEVDLGRAEALPAPEAHQLVQAAVTGDLSCCRMAQTVRPDLRLDARLGRPAAEDPANGLARQIRHLVQVPGAVEPMEQRPRIRTAHLDPPAQRRSGALRYQQKLTLTTPLPTRPHHRALGVVEIDGVGEAQPHALRWSHGSAVHRPHDGRVASRAAVARGGLLVDLGQQLLNLGAPRTAPVLATLDARG